MSCSDCILVPYGSPYQSNLKLPYGEDWVIEQRFKYGEDGESYYNMDLASVEMFIKTSPFQEDADALFHYEDSDFARDSSEEAVSDSVAFNDQILCTIPRDTDISTLTVGVRYWFFIRITDPTTGFDKIYRQGFVEFYIEK